MADSAPRVPWLPLPSAPWRPGRGSPPPRTSPHAPPDALLAHGADLFDGGFWWEAHEVWEGLWGATAIGTPERDLLQGMIQAAAYQIKVRDGQAPAAARLRGRALDRLDRAIAARGDVLLGVDARALRDALAAHGPRTGPLRLRTVTDVDTPTP